MKKRKLSKAVRLRGSLTIPAGEVIVTVSFGAPYAGGMRPQVLATPSAPVAVGVPRSSADGFDIAIAAPLDEDLVVAWSAAVGPDDPFARRVYTPVAADNETADPDEKRPVIEDDPKKAPKRLDPKAWAASVAEKAKQQAATARVVTRTNRR
jgi:hypothetical protein